MDLYTYCTLNDNIAYDRISADDSEDFDSYILSYDDNVLVGCLLYSQIGITNEIRGIVHSDYRRQGIFTKMVSMLKSECNIDDVIFVGKDCYPGIKQCATSFGCVYCFHDFLMEFNPNLFTPKESDELYIEFDEANDSYYYHLDDDLIGSCSIYEENDIINIYEVFIEPPYRGRGFGRQIISDLLWDLVNSGKKIHLHVSESNTVALKLYTSCGFEIKDSVAYYTYKKEFI